MSQIVYIVRLRASHRLNYTSETDQVNRNGGDAEAAFVHKVDAERFILENTPVSVNPFAHDHELSLIDGILTRHYFEPDSPLSSGVREPTYSRFAVSLPELCEDISALGMLPPDLAPGYCKKTWCTWWESVTAKLSLKELRKLQRDLRIHVHAKNPFECAQESTTDDDSGDTWIEFWDNQEVPFRKLRETVAAFGLTLDGIDESANPNEVLDAWWEAHKDKMTDSQKAQLWKLVDPYPYEVVEVELA